MNERMTKEIEEIEGRAHMLRLRVRDLEQAARQLMEVESFLAGYRAAIEAQHVADSPESEPTQ